MELIKNFKPSATYNKRFHFYFKKLLPKSQNYFFSTDSDKSGKNVIDSSVKSNNEIQRNQNQLPSIPPKEMVLKKMNDSLPKRHEISYIVEEANKEVVQSLKDGNIIYPYKSAEERVKTVLKNDFKSGLGRFAQYVSGIDFGFTEVKYFPRHTDILVVGNGPLGLAVACEMKKSFPFGPEVILLDTNYLIPHETTNLGQATLWQQNFIEEEEIQMSKYCVEVMSGFNRHTEIQGKPEFDVLYEPMGTLFLADESNSDAMLLKSDILKKHMVPHKLLSNEKLQNKFSWLNLDNTIFGSLGLFNEGLFDPWTFINGYKCKAANLGVTFVTAAAIDYASESQNLRRIICRLPNGTYNSIDFSYLVLATGLETLNLMNVYNNSDFSPFKLKLPLVEKRKYEYCFYNPDGPGLNTPIVVDSDGTYFRREGLCGYYVVGVPSIDCDDDEKNGVYGVFKNRVEPFLSRRVPDCENYKLCNGWIDTYTSNTANEVGLIGTQFDSKNVIIVNGFQYLGLQQIPAVARAIVEYIAYGHYQTIDFSKFHIENMYLRQHLKAEEEEKKRIEAQKRVTLTG